MARHALPLILLYNGLFDTAIWCTLSEAQRIVASDDGVLYDIIPEFAPNYATIAALAGDKPIRIVDEG